MKKFSKSVLSIALLTCSVAAQAGVYRLDFSANNVVDVFNPSRPSLAPINGSFTYTASSPLVAPSAVDAVNLTIGYFTYLSSDVAAAFGNVMTGYGPTFYSIVGDASLYGRHDDFDFTVVSPGSAVFRVTLNGDNDMYQQVVSFTITDLATAVPEPGSLSLLLAGVTGLAWRSRCRRVGGRGEST